MTVVSLTRLVENATVPTYAFDGDAGADLYASSHAIIHPGLVAVVPTGIAIAMPDNMVGLIHPRSGLATRHGVTVLNAPGTIDSGYRGEIRVILINLGPRPVTFRPGDRIAQIVFQKFERVQFVQSFLEDTERGAGGFGSTGQ